jgi:hypothetical protein
MCSSQSIPYSVVLFEGHPYFVDYNSNRKVVLATDDVEVREDDEDEVVVGLDEAGPGGYVLNV